MGSERLNVTDAVPFFIRSREFVFPNDTLVIVRDRDTTDKAGLRMRPVGQAIEIITFDVIGQENSAFNRFLEMKGCLLIYTRIMIINQVR